MTKRAIFMSAAIVASAGLAYAGDADDRAASDRPMAARAVVAANDNRQPAGQLNGGRLTLALRAGHGRWQPEGSTGPGVDIEAFGEIAGPLMVPAPLIRVPQGTHIEASIRNDLESPLTLHGMCARNGNACPVMTIAPGTTARVEFDAGAPGTYHYWASSFAAPVPFRELAGAFVVDGDGMNAAAATDDRILVITEWSSLTPAQLGAVFDADDPGQAFAALRPGVTFVINGLSWPATERFSYRVGDTARWRVINLSSQAHPMHLHGFYFDVDSVGDGLRDVPVATGARHPVVTQLVAPGTTMTMRWQPEREGNWLFHCHVMHHVSPERRMAARPANSTVHAHETHDSGAGMAGMILGVTVTAPAHTHAAGDTSPAATAAAAATESIAAPDEVTMGDATPGAAGRVAGPAGASHAGSRRARQLTLRMARQENSPEPMFGFVLSGDDVPPATAVASPGPALVLRRGEPVEIAVVNELGERTALHWHGMELDSFYDGVHNWSGNSQQLAPMIEPGSTFVVRFTPPRTGTFIYHTHLHDERQLPLGLYGSLLVVEPDHAFDTALDHPLLLGRQGLDPSAPDVIIPRTPLVINGGRAPVFVWKAGARHRVRLINITPDDILSVSVLTARGPLRWTPAAKDGAELPVASRAATTATQAIAVGETYDFDLDLPPGRQTVWIEVRSLAGKWEAQAQVIAR